MADIAAALLPSKQQRVGWSESKSNHNSRSTGGSGFLVPSQVASRVQRSSSVQATVKPRSNVPASRHSSLIPSQVLQAHPDSVPLPTTTTTTTSSSSTLAETASAAVPPAAPLVVPGKNNPNHKRKRRRTKKTTNAAAAFSSSQEQPEQSGGGGGGRRKKPLKFGNLPDIYWRSITMETLRHHPCVQALPPPHTIQSLHHLEGIRDFRQESWQWDAVHAGRCTTSQAVAAMGFLEPEAGRILGVPRSWQRGGLGAYHRLRQPALRTLDEMNAVLCRGDDNGGDQRNDKVEEPIDGAQEVWVQQAHQESNEGTSGRSLFPFAAKHMVPVSVDEIERRRGLSQAYSKSKRFDFAVRTMWGNAQEATALLTALNYFWQQDPDIVLKEVGMCGTSLATNTTAGGASDLLVGATPDGLLVYPNGTIEALEVKNHCPFFSNMDTARRGGVAARRGGKRFTVRYFDFENAGVQPHYIPQLMMEMLCVGEDCKSAVMVRQSATSGALVLRIRRDNNWIDEMLYWLNRFQADFVARDEPPPENFFLRESSDADHERYSRFLSHTKELQSKVETVAHIPHSQIQRPGSVRPGLTNLFLD